MANYRTYRHIRPFAIYQYWKDAYLTVSQIMLPIYITALRNFNNNSPKCEQRPKLMALSASSPTFLAPYKPYKLSLPPLTHRPYPAPPLCCLVGKCANFNLPWIFIMLRTFCNGQRPQLPVKSCCPDIGTTTHTHAHTDAKANLPCIFIAFI